MALGVAYKRNVSDLRESPALGIIHLLEQKGARVAYHDPHVPAFQYEGLGMSAVVDLDGALVQADCVVAVTGHDACGWGAIRRPAALVFDRCCVGCGIWYDVAVRKGKPANINICSRNRPTLSQATSGANQGHRRDMLLIDKINLLVDRHLFDSEDSLLTTAYRSLLTLHPELKVELAILLYRDGEVSLGRASELAGMSREEIKDLLATRGVERRLFLRPDTTLEEDVNLLLGS